jgi:hypothetical protein
MGISETDRWVQILEDGSEALVLRGLEREIALYYPFNEKAVEMGTVESLDQGICNRLLSRLRGIESEDINDRLNWIGVTHALLISHSFARGIRDSMGFPKVILGVLSTPGGDALRLGMSLSNTSCADPFPLNPALYIKTMLPNPRGCPSGSLGVGPATKVTEESLLVLLVVFSGSRRLRSLWRWRD